MTDFYYAKGQVLESIQYISEPGRMKNVGKLSIFMKSSG